MFAQAELQDKRTLYQSASVVQVWANSKHMDIALFYLFIFCPCSVRVKSGLFHTSERASLQKRIKNTVTCYKQHSFLMTPS